MLQIGFAVSSQFSQRGVIPVWPRDQQINKIHISAYTYPTLIFGMVKDTANIYYCTKNQVWGFCVGGNMEFISWLVPWSKWNYSSIAAQETYTGKGASSQFEI